MDHHQGVEEENGEDADDAAASLNHSQTVLFRSHVLITVSSYFFKCRRQGPLVVSPSPQRHQKTQPSLRICPTPRNQSFLDAKSTTALSILPKGVLLVRVFFSFLFFSSNTSLGCSRHPRTYCLPLRVGSRHVSCSDCSLLNLSISPRKGSVLSRPLSTNFAKETAT